MKKSEFIKELSGMTKISADKLKEIINSEEDIDVEFEKVHVYSDEDLVTLKTNIETEAKKEGGRTTLEMAVKEQRNKLVEKYGEDFNFTGKTIENLVEYAMKAAQKDSSKGDDEKIVERDKQITALKKAVDDLESQNENLTKEKDSIINEFETNSTITKAIPSDVSDIWSPEDLSVLFKKDHQVVIEDGKRVVKRGGEILRDKKQDPVPVDEVVKEWLTKKGVMNSNPGRGEHDRNKNKTDKDYLSLNSMDEILDYAKEHSMNNQQQVELTQKVMKENKNFKYD